MADLQKISKLSIVVDNYFCTRFTESRRLHIYQVLTFFLTFMSYMLYHANRKVVGIVKQVWNENCTQAPPDVHNTSNWCDWAPFDGSNADSLFAYMDASFLGMYALAMYLSGYLAERSNLRVYLSAGMVLTGIFNLLVGASYWMKIHSYAYFLLIDMVGGVFQATGWPAVVALMGNWFGRSRRGAIMGLWNIHTSVGNMVGSFVAGLFVDGDWGLSFAVPSACIMAFSAVVLLLQVSHPRDVGLDDPNEDPAEPMCRQGARQECQPLLNAEDSLYNSVEDDPQHITTVGREGSVSRSRKGTESGAANASVSQVSEKREGPAKAISLLTAFLIPGVITYAVALFFIKFVNYVFLFWLPKYIHTTTSFSARESANMSMFFDLGGILGGVVAGALSDRFKRPATTCCGALIVSLPMLGLYYIFGGVDAQLSAGLLFTTGVFVNAPYALITTAVSAELGQHRSLHGNAHALATVTAIIDGTGSLGATLGPLLTGLVAESLGWQYVFEMLIIASAIAILCLTRLVWHELWRACRSPNNHDVHP